MFQNAGLAALGIGLTIIGAGIGIGMIASAAMGGIARQPEASNKITVGMLLGAALIEGATFFAIIICSNAIN